ncbi:MAG: DUF3445 domain-containing protein [Silicimonas sp.]|nr:DUF3445 domain-containing protein [Silicimonas sp.]
MKGVASPPPQTIPQTQRDVAARALPGMQRLDGPDWITVDAAYTAQLATKARLIEERPRDVIACLPQAQEAVAETLEEVFGRLGERPDFVVGTNAVQRPDGVMVDLDRSAPLETLSRLIQEDLCILQEEGETHVLTAALLCFPASWMLSEKLGRGLPAIHRPVAEYTGDIAKRVQRLFDGIKVGQPMWRANYLPYQDRDLYQPRSEDDRRGTPKESAPFERSERQTLWRLPMSRAVVFSIHTTVCAVVPPDQ